MVSRVSRRQGNSEERRGKKGSKRTRPQTSVTPSFLLHLLPLGLDPGITSGTSWDGTKAESLTSAMCGMSLSQTVWWGADLGTDYQLPNHICFLTPAELRRRHFANQTEGLYFLKNVYCTPLKRDSKENLLWLIPEIFLNWWSNTAHAQKGCSGSYED